MVPFTDLKRVMGLHRGVFCGYAELRTRILEEISCEISSSVVGYNFWVSCEYCYPKFNKEVQRVLCCLIRHNLATEYLVPVSIIYRTGFPSIHMTSASISLSNTRFRLAVRHKSGRLVEPKFDMEYSVSQFLLAFVNAWVHFFWFRFLV